MRLPIKLFTSTARVPERAHADDAGCDLFISDDCREPLFVGETRKVSLGVGVEVPEGHVGLLLPRSSTSLRGLLVHPGVVDAGYRGQLAATVTNLTREHVPLQRGMKLCQLLIVPIALPTVEVVEELSESARGTGSFGSTGGGL